MHPILSIVISGDTRVSLCKRIARDDEQNLVASVERHLKEVADARRHHEMFSELIDRECSTGFVKFFNEVTC